MTFRAPVGDIAFSLRHIAGLDEMTRSGLLGDLSPDMVDAILAEAGKFTEEELAPLNAIGDREGCRLSDGAVTTARGWKDAYQRWREAGWNGVSAPSEWGGQELPVMLHVALQELWNAGSAAFAVGPMLTASAIEALTAHASPESKALYLPCLVSGEWMATMNLTEPQAGSDLGALRSRAEPAGDGTYRIFGQKIFITYGEHDLTENIVHLVLARLPDAPPGTSGISLFLVPKFLPKDDGSPGERNDLLCAGIEEKLGIHGSPTCTMIYGEKGGAVGWLIGEENRGLNAMFTMMNIARLTVGIQGVGVAARAYDQALAYARERLQGRAPGAPAGTMSPIVEHPDIRRMLLRMKALTAASRAICHACAHAIDMSRRGPEGERPAWADRASLLTPLAKSFSTDSAIEVASLGIQVHGGTGYIEETGAARHLRDARIFAIYEGTNGIQAIDLVMRKLRLGDGDVARRLISELSEESVSASGREDFGRTGPALKAACENLTQATDTMTGFLATKRERDALAVATPYCRLFALTVGGALLAKGALAAGNSSEGRTWTPLARFFAETMLGETAMLRAEINEGGKGMEAAAIHLQGN